MSQEGFAGSKFWYAAVCAAGTVPRAGTPAATTRTVAAAHGSKEKEGKAEVEPYGRKSRSRHSTSVVGAH